MNFNEEQIKSFNRLSGSFVSSNKYLSEAAIDHERLITLNHASQLIFNFDCLTERYQRKFILNNFELYCTSLFIALKPRILTFLKNEGLTGYTFNSIYILGQLRVERFEKVSIR
ncbi:hypothetical protein DBR11_11630 [Pedobacter sp. HMWF019]|uniref:hypothetical protein n=1 Tax=Pedobacter sp. HMWF019 TaxID=2056856 RepID=UPI000D33458E|nr:hypothetical protein [Pedobacter sp. HMWF019]PTS99711.1 hypothetical protein DBR11_11630 [Pedobacter sp. HMWF019]